MLTHAALAALILTGFDPGVARAQNAEALIQRGEGWNVFFPAANPDPRLHKVLEELRHAKSLEPLEKAGDRLDQWESDFVAKLYETRTHVPFYDDSVTSLERLRFWELVLSEKNALLALKAERRKLPDGRQGRRLEARLNEIRAQITAPDRNMEALDLYRRTLDSWAWRNAGRSSIPSSPLSSGYTTVSTTPPPVPGQPQAPIPGVTVLSGLGDARDGGRRRHQGWDLFLLIRKGGRSINKTWSQSVRPMLAGIVTKVIPDRPYRNSGNYVEVQHYDARGRPGINTKYMHLLDICVGPGQCVGPDTIIGHAGNTGNARNGPAHLHFEVRGPHNEVLSPKSYIGRYVLKSGYVR